MGIKYQFVPYLWISFAVAAIVICLIVHTLRNKSVPGARYLLLTLVLVIVWVMAQACEMAAITLRTKIFWANIQYMPIMLTPVTYFYFSIQFTKQDKWMRLRWLPVLLLIPPIVYNILLWTDGAHELIRQNVHLVFSNSFSTVGKTYGPLFWAFSVYNFSLCIFTLGILANALREKVLLYREQVLFLFWGLFLPGCACALYIAGLSPINIDPTPIVFGLSGLLITFGLFRYRLFGVVPIARSIIIQEMTTGIIVLDNEGKVLDINPAAKKIFNLSSADLIGLSIEKLISDFPDMGIDSQNVKALVTEIVIENSGEVAHYEISLTQLVNSHHKSIGWLLQAYNITDRKASEDIIRHLALHDALTGLPNRNYFREFLSKEITRARISGGSLAVAYLDLDDFKLINDSYGHNYGDKYLCEVVQRLRIALRDSDMIARLGGDEFAILFPSIGTDEKIVIVGNKIMSSLEKPVVIDGNSVDIKASIGFSMFPRDGETVEVLLNKADKAMYMVKETMKNTYCIYKD